MNELLSGNPEMPDKDEMITAAMESVRNEKDFKYLQETDFHILGDDGEQLLEEGTTLVEKVGELLDLENFSSGNLAHEYFQRVLSDLKVKDVQSLVKILFEEREVVQLFFEAVDSEYGVIPMYLKELEELAYQEIQEFGIELLRAVKRSEKDTSKSNGDDFDLDTINLNHFDTQFSLPRLQKEGKSWKFSMKMNKQSKRDELGFEPNQYVDFLPSENSNERTIMVYSKEDNERLAHLLSSEKCSRLLKVILAQQIYFDFLERLNKVHAFYKEAAYQKEKIISEKVSATESLVEDHFWTLLTEWVKESKDEKEISIAYHMQEHTTIHRFILNYLEDMDAVEIVFWTPSENFPPDEGVEVIEPQQSKVLVRKVEGKLEFGIENNSSVKWSEYVPSTYSKINTLTRDTLQSPRSSDHFPKDLNKVDPFLLEWSRPFLQTDNFLSFVSVIDGNAREKQELMSPFIIAGKIGTIGFMRQSGIDDFAGSAEWN